MERGQPTTRLALLTLAAAAIVLVAVTGGSAAPPPGTPGQQTRDEVLAYWTPERVARAVPREVSPDRSHAFVPRETAKPPGTPGGGGGGGGGGDGATVGGAFWTADDLVRKTTGKVLFTMGGVNYVCSGSVVQDTSSQRSLVLTAGHCVYDETGRAFATNWLFVPDYEAGKTFACDSTRFGCWTAQALVTTSAWANGGGSLAGFNDDYGFAVLGSGGKTGQSNQLDTTVGTNSIAFNQAHPTQIYAFGYPHAAPYDGTRLAYCAGRDVADTWGGTTSTGLKCDMTGGSSGGPWFVGFSNGNSPGSLNSVNSFKYTAGKLKGHMFGPYFDAYTQKTYTAATTAGANTLVAP